MEKLRNTYILLQDGRFGENLWSIDLRSTPKQLLKGELLEALPETAQPVDSTRIAVINYQELLLKRIRLHCRKEDAARLTREEHDLLLAISSVTLRYQIYIDRGRMDFGKRLGLGSEVMVSVQGCSKNLPGVVWYKGVLPNIRGTMFGVQLHGNNPGCGTCDGTFQNQRYFTCDPTSGVFVALDKLTPVDHAKYKYASNSPERDDHGHATLKSKLRNVLFPFSIWKDDHSLQAVTVQTLEIGQRVVTFLEDNNNPVRGTVRFLGEEKGASGRVVVGLELDERIGSGTGKWYGRQYFVCGRDYATFVDIQTVISEKDFDGDPGEATTRTTSQNQDKQCTNSIKHEKRQNEATFSTPLSDDVNKTSEKEKANLERQLEVLQQQLREKEERLANYQAQVKEGNLREASLIQQLQEKELQRENSERQLQEMEEQIRVKEDDKANLERQLREMAQSFEERTREKEEEKTNLETQLGMKNQELSELETSLSVAQQMIIELRRQESCDWVISRDEVQVKGKYLGKGAWGSVNEATYCGCKVAVKQIHELILSPHNRRLFEREMNIASRCRHPCLLQFIGATNDVGNPLFVTELMELSLRALLEQRQLTETEIYVISLDVSRALNYLHHMKPSPIVHRDVSSANVLLWRQGEQWRGKVSDYGTAKFVQQTMTVAPGALIYSAPEAVSSNQTSKVDVYSFGVLLCEMWIQEMPDPERREEQVLLVRNRFFRNLVRQCLQADPAMRPDMAQIIQELEQYGGIDRLN
ncbi:probable serine/threonine-protein kinase DDB_G0271682 [Montipora capricornis]|uniref:probable serine/threonine-protein kinase DDB_G0271682 n=1 Tax=Montipora capricornis TaxID=246305 RepID=UPI0035F11413